MMMFKAHANNGTRTHSLPAKNFVIAVSTHTARRVGYQSGLEICVVVSQPIQRFFHVKKFNLLERHRSWQNVLEHELSHS